MLGYNTWRVLRWLRRGLAGAGAAWVWYWVSPTQEPRYFIAFLGPLALFILYRAILRVLREIGESDSPLD